MLQPNLNFLVQQTNGNASVYKRIVAVALEELRSDYSLYQEYLKNNEYLHAAKLVHKLKSKFGLFEMHDAQRNANAYESDLREKVTATGLHDQIATFKSNVECLLVFLKKVSS